MIHLDRVLAALALGLAPGCAVGLTLSALAASAVSTGAQVQSHAKISASEGWPGDHLDDEDVFGNGVTSLGDLDGDGIDDLAVGAAQDDDGFANAGAAWILFLNSDGSVGGEQKISATEGGFIGAIAAGDAFGIELEGIGDFDGDGVPDLAAGVELKNETGPQDGAAFLIFLNADGTVKDYRKYSNDGGALGATPLPGDRFGSGVTDIGDLDGDGFLDLAVGAYLEDDGGTRRGAVYILFLNADGTLKSSSKISSTQGGFGGTLDDDDHFGVDLAFLGDYDGDGLADLAVGASQDDDGGENHGAIWILHLASDGSVHSEQKISDTEGGFEGVLATDDSFGAGLSVFDADGDGMVDLSVAANRNDTGGLDQGAVWILFLATDGTVRGHHKISAEDGGFTGELEPEDRFGSMVSAVEDLDGNGTPDLAVGSLGDDDGGPNRGAVWVLFLGCMQGSEEVTRLGLPPNPEALLPGVTGPPIVGTTWSPVVDHTSFAPAALLDGLLVAPFPANLPTGLGTLLCSITASPLIFTTPPGVPFTLPIGIDCALVGAAPCVQAASIDASGSIALTNALDVVVGSF